MCSVEMFLIPSLSCVGGLVGRVWVFSRIPHCGMLINKLL